jgi:GNAT superfamily N-acetyltransferase
MTLSVSAETFQLRDGRQVVLRRTVRDDAPRLASLCERLSAHTSRLRFRHVGRRLSSEEAVQLADIDQVSNAAVVALDADRVIALGTLHRLGDDPQAELTLLVDDAYQGRGLGRRLLAWLIQAARERHYHLLLGELLPDNERMLRLLESAGLRSLADECFGVLRVYLFLAKHAARTSTRP